MSASNPNDDRLPERAEALLVGWPAPSRSALEWEEAANTTMGRVRATEAGSTPEELLSAPLPEANGEQAFDLDLPDDEPRLADIARAVVLAEPAARREMAKEGLLVAQAAQNRAGQPPPARSETRPARAAGVAGLQSRVAKGSSPPERTAPALHEAPARSELPHEVATMRTGTMAIGAALALAAGIALFIALEKRDAEPSAAVEQPAPPHFAASNPSPGVAAPPPAAEGPAEGQRTLALDELPAGQAEGAGVASKTAAKARSAPSAATDSLAFHVEQASPSSKDKLVLEEREDRDEAANAAPEPATPTQAAAPRANAEPAQTGGALPNRPGVGAIQAAVGSVMTGARSCLSGQEEGSKVSITFGSDGRVSAIGVSGPAAGTPAEGCLRSALMGARVPPFTEHSFSAALTVRPP